jgi:uncharacterized phiE125 gp8 family phage protein
MTTPPVAEPMTTDELKLHLRVDHSNDDDLIAYLLRAAREYCEVLQGRAYIVRTYAMTFDNGWPVEIFSVPYPPLVSVSSITYLDADGDTQTLATTEYTVDTKTEPARIYEAYNKTWPTIRDVRNTITVTFIAGYAAKFTAATSDVCTVSGRTYTNGDKVRVWNSGGSSRALPTGLSADTDYYVVEVSGSTCKLSLTEGGVAVDITGTGTGTHYISHAEHWEMPRKISAAIKLLVGHWYENREEITDIKLAPVPLAAAALLQQDRVNW